MKKSFLLAAFAGILLAGCTSDEQTEVATSRTDNPIVFNSPIVNAQTRAVAGEQPVWDATNSKYIYSTSENFRVYAVQHIGNFQGWTAAETQLYLNNLEVIYKPSINDNGTTKAGWEPSFPVYWPKTENAKLTFAAYSPSEASEFHPTYNGSGLSLTDFTPKSNVAEQYDLMYSSRSYNRTESKNELTSGTDHTINSYDGVDILFHHALSSINFKAKTAANYSNTEIKIKKITINNAYTTADFKENITNEEVAHFASDPSWSNFQTPRNYVVYDSETSALSTALSTDAIDLGSPALLIPQKMDGTDASSPAQAKEIKVTVNYTIKVGEGTAVAQTGVVSFKDGYNNGYFNDGNGNDIKAWEMGKRYTYTISIGLNNIIYFSPEVDDWKNINAEGDITI